MTAVRVATTSAGQVMMAREPKLQEWMLYRVSRKLAKLMFGMFPMYERKEYYFLAMCEAFVTMISKRTPRVNYETRKYKQKEKFNADFTWFTERIADLTRQDETTTSFCNDRKKRKVFI